LSQKYISGPEQFPDCSLNASLLLGALRPELRQPELRHVD
jgi:hypothetical protein